MGVLTLFEEWLDVWVGEGKQEEGREGKLWLLCKIKPGVDV